MSMRADVIVVGGGMAGCQAAYAALKSGRSVALFARHTGHTGLGSGAVDLLGAVPGAVYRGVFDLSAGLAQLCEADAGHPYARWGGAIQRAVEQLKALLALGGYALSGDGIHNRRIPNLLGTFSCSAYLPAALKALSDTGGDKILVVGFPYHKSFSPAFAARAYAQIEVRHRLPKNRYIDAVLDLPAFGGRTRVLSGELANFFDSKAGSDALLQAVSELLAAHPDADRLLFPPVLGYFQTAELIRRLEQETGTSISEIAGYADGVAGSRLSAALHRGLKKAGARLFFGYTVHACVAGDGGVRFDMTAGVTDQFHPGERVCASGRAAVIAAGGLLGGGISVRDQRLRADLLSLDLGGLSESDLKTQWLHPAGQPVLRRGVPVRDDLTPEDPAFDNLYVCGEMLDGFNGAAEKSTTGVAALTGYLAGLNAAQTNGGAQGDEDD